MIASLQTENTTLRDIKSDPLKESEVDAMGEMAGSYEALFSRRAMKYKSMGLADKALTEEDYRHLILEEYTFLKRPIILTTDEIFVGSAKKTVAIGVALVIMEVLRAPNTVYPLLNEHLLSIGVKNPPGNVFDASLDRVHLKLICCDLSSKPLAVLLALEIALLFLRVPALRPTPNPASRKLSLR